MLYIVLYIVRFVISILSSKLLVLINTVYYMLFITISCADKYFFLQTFLKFYLLLVHCELKKHGNVSSIWLIDKNLCRNSDMPCQKFDNKLIIRHLEY